MSTFMFIPEYPTKSPWCGKRHRCYASMLSESAAIKLDNASSFCNLLVARGFLGFILTIDWVHLFTLETQGGVLAATLPVSSGQVTSGPVSIIGSPTAAYCGRRR
jgi:hypothetical protein